MRTLFFAEKACSKKKKKKKVLMFQLMRLHCTFRLLFLQWQYWRALFVHFSLSVSTATTAEPNHVLAWRRFLARLAKVRTQQQQLAAGCSLPIGCCTFRSTGIRNKTQIKVHASDGGSVLCSVHALARSFGAGYVSAAWTPILQQVDAAGQMLRL